MLDRNFISLPFFLTYSQRRICPKKRKAKKKNKAKKEAKEKAKKKAKAKNKESQEKEKGKENKGQKTKEEAQAKKAFESAVRTIYDAKNMDEAVRIASIVAQEDDIVVFSPACKPSRQYETYNDRGNQFKKSIKQAEDEWHQ